MLPIIFMRKNKRVFCRYEKLKYLVASDQLCKLFF